MGEQGGSGTTRYRAFGDLVVRTSDGEQVLRRRRERDTLAVLLAVRAPVSADRLLAEVWDSGAALGSLQAVVSRLRDAVEPHRTARGENRCLVSSSAGYAVRADVADVDTWWFEDLATGCLTATRPEEALALFEQADALWTGEPYADCSADAVDAARARLVDLRTSSAERAAQALLDLGRPEQVGLLLARHVEEHPFRERLYALLALAHYRCGRQSEALATLRDLRARLADELGVDPTPEVRRLETDLLRQDASLDGPAPTAPTAPTATPTPTSPPGDVPAHEVPTDPIVGRDEPLARVTAVLDRLSTGRQVLTVLGEPGIGKTRLVEETLRRAAERGLRTVVGQCHQGDVAPALWPWAQVVRALTTRGSGDPSESQALLLPLLDDGVPVDTGSGSLRLYEAVAALLESRARQAGGLVVVLEDLHWADATSLQLLTHLVEQPSTAPLLVLVTRRTTEGDGSDQMLSTLASLARAGAERIRLDGLSRTEVGLLLGRLLARGAEDLSPVLVDVVDEATSGNAFFVQEYARLLQTLGDVASVDRLPVPDGVRDVIGQRVNRLPAETRELLHAAAVLGRDIEPQDVAALAGQSLDDALDHLDLALATGLLEERGGGYTFAHALTREALHAELAAGRRIRLHARAADVLAERLGEAPDAAADIAHHALLAAPLGPERARTAFTWLGRAARVALARQAPLESRALWVQAQRVADDLGLEDERLHAMLGVARSAVRMGTFTEAPTLVKELAREASRLGHWDLVASAAATFASAGAWTWRVHGRKEEELIELFTAALEHVDAADEATLCAALTIEHQFGWDSAASDAFAARAIDAARRADDHDLLCSALLGRAISTAGRADLGSRVALVRELIDAGPRAETEVAGLFHLAYALHETGQVTEAEATMREAEDKARTLTHSGLDVPLAWWRAAVATDHDDPDARRIADDALALHLGQRFYYGTELQTLHAVVHREPGTPLAEEVVEGARAGLHAERALVAWSLMESGELDRAADALGEMPPEHAVDYSIEASLCLRLLVAAALGRHDDVGELLRRIDRYTTPLAEYGSVHHLGAFDHFRAVGHRALGDPARALELARSAVATNRRCDIRPWLRRSEALAAELEREVGLLETRPGEEQVGAK